ncbi:hypothetical protein GJ699_27700 [Duganella sp. FT80W]|uniref:FMN hydroxy acid dehydrogenase domain-containing protein n=1 Tax=Duganella guangzhouensis TaxID=2666084 RepID=A0A6I2LAL3_9BURK|nr:alpha-hydroxy-acid oxidizing protein [Duganella guangzhouensis]MRW93786.1 hypothetical protein [Duganella guangzhouensis]
MTDDSRRFLIKTAAALAALPGLARAVPQVAEPALASSAPAVNGFAASSAEGPLELINLIELEAQAAKVIAPGAFSYIARGAGDEWTLRDNRNAFNRQLIIPRVLSGEGPPDLRTQILGTPIASPIIITPVAAHGLAHVSAEAGTARGAAAAGTILGVSTVSTLNLEQVAAAANGPKWFQLYMLQDVEYSAQLLRRAKAAGYKAVVLTADTTVVGNREDGQRQRFTFPLKPGNLLGDDPHAPIPPARQAFAVRIDQKTIEFAIRESGLPVIVKGISHPDDALKAIEAGASGIQVSNHGGRQLDGAPGAFSVLPAVAKAVKRQVPIIFDSGIRRGQDVFKALASGADVVAIGRPVLYGLALGGAQGVQAVLQHLNRELSITMQLAGTQTVADIKATVLQPA